MSGVRVAAPAKVNLTLEVLGRRADGYHELASVMATIDLADDVRVGRARSLDVRIRPPLDLPVAGGSASFYPRDRAVSDDLATRAAVAIARACGREPRLHVVVRKRIPVAAGLGGGSSDAAAVLRAAAALWRVDLDLVALGATIGSDVPFFASSAPVARVGGRGERVDPIPPPREPFWIALVRVPARVATPEVFGAYSSRGAPPSSTPAWATDALARSLASGSATPSLLRELARNDLTATAERLCPPIAEARAAAKARGIDLVLSGSGPSLFAIADDRADALRIARSLRRVGLRARPHAVAMTARA